MYISEKSLCDNWQCVDDEAFSYYYEENKKQVIEEMEEMYHYRLCENK